MKKILYTAFYFCSALLLSSCIGDLDQYPHEDETSSTIYTSADNYKAVLGKIYAAMVTTGQEKGGDPDLSSNSGQDYMRCFFNLQECGTDEVASTWLSGDNVTGLTYLSWDANDPWVSDMYYRIYYNIALCNEFLRNATDESIARFTEQEQTEIRHYRAEARFMRAPLGGGNIVHKGIYALGIGIGILNSGGAVYAVLLSLQIDRRIKFDLFLVIEIFHIIRNAARKMIFSRLKALGRLLALVRQGYA